MSLFERGIIITPTYAQHLGVNWDVPDYFYVEREEPPALDHGVVWAHSLGASPPDLFAEIILAIDQRIDALSQRHTESWSRLQGGWRRRSRNEG